jgi:beta-N-acetylhexosaminidase
MREALTTLLENRGEDTVVLCTGIPEDRALVPDGVASATTSGRNVVVLEAVAKALTQDGR